MTASIPRRDYGANAERIHYSPAYRPVTDDWVVRHRSGNLLTARRGDSSEEGVIMAFETATEAEAWAAVLNLKVTGESFAS